MAVKTAQYLSNLAQDTQRGPSNALWGRVDIPGLLENPALGMYFWDDFLGGANIPSATGAAVIQGISDRWTIYAYQASTIVDAAIEGGGITIANTTTSRGVAFGGSAGWARIITTSTNALNKKLVFEARVNVSTITASKQAAFIGLFDSFLSSGLPQAGFPIQAGADTPAATMNCIGFEKTGAAPTDWQFVYQLSGQTAVYPTNLTTLCNTALGAVLTTTQYVKLGFVFDPNAVPQLISSASTGQTAGVLSAPLITIYVNGLVLPAFLNNTNLTTNFPTGFMSPGFAVMNQSSSSPGNMTVDWIRCVQGANS